MNINDRVDAIAKLGKHLLSVDSSGKENYWKIINSAHLHNPWFTPEFCKYAIESIAKKWLNKSSLNKWISLYPKENFYPEKPKRVGVVMAGNVPFVGLHDMISVLITGNIFIGKASSKDGGLMEKLAEELVFVEPRFKNHIFFTQDILEKFDAIIATGSSNSGRYFEHYFGKYPNIIRYNRHSVAIIDGSETENELQGLAADIFTYFGLGCRNVSKILIPDGYNIDKLMTVFEPFRYLYNHNKYANNYDYYRAIYLMNSVEHYDNGFVILKPDNSLGSPVGVIYYQNYSGIESAKNYLDANLEHIQCVVSNNTHIPNAICFGMAQQPTLTDYADRVDTLIFLNTLQDV